MKKFHLTITFTLMFTFTNIMHAENIIHAEKCGFNNILTEPVYNKLFPSKIIPYDF